MGQKTEIMDKLLELFYEYPDISFTIRELARKTNVPKSTVQKYLLELKKKQLVIAGNKAANTKFFKIKKAGFYIERLFQAGLIDYLQEKLVPSCIILFGSFRKGESEAGSDIDLFVETTKKAELDLSRFEKQLKHKLHIIIEQDIKKLPQGLFNNIANGIKLMGYFKIK